MSEQQYKLCNSCKAELLLTEDNFSKNRNASSGYSYRCRKCENARLREYRQKHLSYATNWHLLNKYGITVEERDAMILQQNGLCLICRKPLCHPVVDHDHVTGKVRGVLCREHNSILGLAGDSIEILCGSIDYLQAHNNEADLEYF